MGSDRVARHGCADTLPSVPRRPPCAMATKKTRKPQAKGMLSFARCRSCNNCTPLLHHGLLQDSAHARTRAQTCPGMRDLSHIPLTSESLVPSVDLMRRAPKNGAPELCTRSQGPVLFEKHFAHASKSLGCCLPRYAQKMLLTFSETPLHTLLCNPCTARRSTNIGGKPQWEPLRSSANRDAKHGKLSSPAWAFAGAHNHPLGAGIRAQRRARQGHLARLRTAASR